MNSYNDYPIPWNSWQAVIQPKYKVTMAMIVSTALSEMARCAHATFTTPLDDELSLSW